VQKNTNVSFLYASDWSKANINGIRDNIDPVRRAWGCSTRPTPVRFRIKAFQIEQKNNIGICVFLVSQSLLTHNPAPLPEYKSSSLKRSRFIFSHYGLLKGVWDWLVVLATVYVAIAVPFLAAFVQQESRNLLPDVLVESLFIGGKIFVFVFFKLICFLIPNWHLKLRYFANQFPDWTILLSKTFSLILM